MAQSSKPNNFNKAMSVAEIGALEEKLLGYVEEGKMKKLVNDVKCDAIYTAKSYEEFRDRVAAAHLQPLEKKDSLQYKSAGNWNLAASKEKDENK